MDTHGHQEISDVGERLIKPALKEAGRENMRISAFYLGNWLTDVSQTVDSRAYRAAFESVKEITNDIAALFDRMHYDAPSWVPGVIDELGQELIGKVRTQVNSAKTKVIRYLERALGEGGDLARGFHAAFRYIGYYKFILADDGTSETKMDRDCYFKVFDDRFRQYFPHEHLDRPETSPGCYAVAKASGPLNKWTRTAASSGSHDLYDYLRQDIKTAAGLLAYLDGGSPNQPRGSYSWAMATFNRALTGSTGWSCSSTSSLIPSRRWRSRRGNA